MFKTIGIGEILWDILGKEKHLGGAPFNFAYYTKSLGEEGIIISRIGKDQLGDEILNILERLRISNQGIQSDEIYPTGKVLVTIDQGGEPSFHILERVAYDYIVADKPILEMVEDADAVCFGTLAQRCETSRKSIQAIVEAARKATIIYDINLRQNFYSLDIIERSVSLSHILKLNDKEITILKHLFQQEKMINDDFLLKLLESYNLKLICVTLGKNGCILRAEQEHIYSPGYRVEIVDTVGSGDAFTAGLIYRYLRGDGLPQIADFANLFGAYIATQRGATPPVDLEKLERFRLEHTNKH